MGKKTAGIRFQGEARRNLLLDIQVSDDGLEQVRRKDRKPLTDEDFKEARRLLDNLPGITVNDVL